MSKSIQQQTDEIIRELIREQIAELTESFGSSPKCIFIGGPSGAGKSTFIRKHLPNGFKEINSDNEYEELLKKAGMGMRQKDFDSDELSKAAKFQARARKSTKYRLKHSMEHGIDIIIDGTAASVNPIKNKKRELEKLGYDTFMILLYVSPLISLKRNMIRGEMGGRELNPNIILRTWKGVIKNIDEYRRLFKKNIVVIDNNPDDVIKDFDKEMIEPFFSQKDKDYKPKSPEELEKRRKRKEKMYDDIEKLAKELPDTDSVSDMKSKLNRFLRK